MSNIFNIQDNISQFEQQQKINKYCKEEQKGSGTT